MGTHLPLLFRHCFVFKFKAAPINLMILHDTILEYSLSYYDNTVVGYTILGFPR